MHKFLLAGVALVGAVLMATPVQAGHKKGCCEPCCPAPCAPMCVSYVDKVVTCYKTEWRERDVSYTVCKVVPHVEVVPMQCTVMVPVWTQKTVTCTVYRSVPRVVDRQVTSCHMVPVTCTDPCTGCSYTCCKPETVVQTVHCTVYDCVPEQKQYTVNVCSYKSETRTYETRRVVCETKQEVVKGKERYCVQVPYQATVKVAVCTPCCATTACCN